MIILCIEGVELNMTSHYRHPIYWNTQYLLTVRFYEKPNRIHEIDDERR
jgi:hypothetical protein